MIKGNPLVKEAMKIKPITVQPSTSVYEAATLMAQHAIGNCIVVDEKPIGIITESDIVKKVVAQDLQASQIPVEKIMSTPLLVTDPYVSLEEAMKTMGKCNIRRLPVVEQGELIGIITQKDISRISPILHEISREWLTISGADESYWRKQVFSGKCEDCGALSAHLKNVDGRLLCEDCLDALKFEQ
jgi:CBS domain-containing protein